jgi:flagellar operon protein
MKTERPFLYPSVTSVPKVSPEKASELRKPQTGPSEFDQIFNESIHEPLEKSGAPEKMIDLQQLKAPLKLSSHASQRLSERQIKIDPQTWAKVNDAVDRAEAKGIEDTLVLTSDAALIVNVKNRTVITAMDKGSLTGNVFTNIDGAVIV